MEQIENTNPNKVEEPTWKQMWRPLSAYIYLMIVVFDFMVAPMMYMAYSAVQTQAAQYEFLEKHDFTKEEIMATIEKMPTPPPIKDWTPLTLGAGGLFHLAFGAILGIGSWTRGKEKQTRIEQGQY